MNLVSNARDAMPDGGRLTLETANVDVPAEDALHPLRATPGRYVLLKVSDSGPGMPEEVRQHAFEPFFSTKGGMEITGLGLSTAYGIVTPERRPDPGRQRAGERHPLPHLPPQRRGGRRPPRAPDDGARSGRSGRPCCSWRTRRTSASRSSRSWPTAATTSSPPPTPLEAIQISQAHPGPIHLMITDILMDGMSGVELAERLSFKRPEMRVLFATGYPAGLTEGTSLGRRGQPPQEALQRPRAGHQDPGDPPGRGLREVFTTPDFGHGRPLCFCYKPCDLRGFRSRPERSAEADLSGRGPGAVEISSQGTHAMKSKLHLALLARRPGDPGGRTHGLRAGEAARTRSFSTAGSSATSSAPSPACSCPTTARALSPSRRMGNGHLQSELTITSERRQAGGVLPLRLGDGHPHPAADPGLELLLLARRDQVQELADRADRRARHRLRHLLHPPESAARRRGGWRSGRTARSIRWS